MKHTVLLLFITAISFSALRSQALDVYTYQYKHKKAIVLYSFMAERDSVFIVGHIKEKKTGTPITGVNINETKARFGTVSNRVGELGKNALTSGDFRLFLLHKEGHIRFHNYGVLPFDFELSYDLHRSEILKKSENTYSHH